MITLNNIKNAAKVSRNLAALAQLGRNEYHENIAVRVEGLVIEAFGRKCGQMQVFAARWLSIMRAAQVHGATLMMRFVPQGRCTTHPTLVTKVVVWITLLTVMAECGAGHD
jgi:hypothetical protein